MEYREAGGGRMYSRCDLNSAGGMERSGPLQVMSWYPQD